MDFRHGLLGADSVFSQETEAKLLAQLRSEDTKKADMAAIVLSAAGHPEAVPRITEMLGKEMDDKRALTLCTLISSEYRKNDGVAAAFIRFTVGNRRTHPHVYLVALTKACQFLMNDEAFTCAVVAMNQDEQFAKDLLCSMLDFMSEEDRLSVLGKLNNAEALPAGKRAAFSEYVAKETVFVEHAVTDEEILARIKDGTAKELDHTLRKLERDRVAANPKIKQALEEALERNTAESTKIGIRLLLGRPPMENPPSGGETAKKGPAKPAAQQDIQKDGETGGK